jgi:hypothetical protein
MLNLHKLKTFTEINTHNPRRWAPALVVIVAITVVGTLILVGSHAAGPYLTINPDLGNVISPASTQTCSGAADGNCVQFGATSSGGGTSSAAPANPAATNAEICNNSSELSGPSTAPSGAVTVAAGDNSSTTLNTPNTTYWFAPGTHTIGTSQYSQIDPGVNDTYIGAPGAILSGQGKNDFAFVSNYEAPYDTGVTIEYLTIEDFIPPGSGGAVNQNGGPGWTIENDTIEDNIPGAAMMLGTDGVIQDNCLTENGQYAFNSYSILDTSSLTSGPSNINLNHNEISYNNTCNWEVDSNFPITSPAGCSGGGQFKGCGCAGGGKFWENQNVTVTDNYDVGLWADTNNDGVTFSGNYIANSYGPGLQYEVSYNSLIENNTFVENGIGEGEAKIGFPVGAIYLSESGGDSRVANSANIDTITVSGNVFTNNWDGVFVPTVYRRRNVRLLTLR